MSAQNQPSTPPYYSQEDVILNPKTLPPNAVHIEIPPKYLPFLTLQRAEKQQLLLGKKTVADVLYAKWTPCGSIYDGLHRLMHFQKENTANFIDGKGANAPNAPQKNFFETSHRNVYVTKDQFDDKLAGGASRHVHNIGENLDQVKVLFRNCVAKDENMVFYAIREKNMMDWMQDWAEGRDNMERFAHVLQQAHEQQDEVRHEDNL